MKRKNSIVVLLLATLLLVLAACAEAVPGTEPANEAGIEASEGAAPVTEEDGVVKTIYVGPELVDCVGVGPQQCMLVKEDPNAEYQYHYTGIEGFDYEPGYEYELLIRETTIDNPPADGSSLQWTLIEVVSKTPAQTAVAPAASETPGRIVTAFVGPELVDCVGVAPQQCLQYKTNPDDDYSLFYDSIDGFNFEPGYEYELSVLVEPVQNPPADASALKYTLVEVVSQTPVAAAGVEGEATSPLQGSTWVLASYMGADGSMITALPDIEATASFQDGQVSGMGSCNRYFGSYEVDGSSLSFSQFGSTMMACQPEIMQQEAAFLAAMGSTAGFEISNDQLLLQDANGQTVVILNSEQAAPSADMPETTLTDMTWVMTAYLGAQGEQVDALPDTRVTASFADGQVGGTAGCNRYFGSYETDGSASLAFGPLGSSMMMCFPEEVMLQETAFLANMSSVAAYEILNGQLLLQDAEGQTVLVFNGEQPITLTNTTWIVTGYNNGNQAVVGVATDTEMTAVFAEDGTMSGSAGCNNYRATYTIDGDTINIGPAAATRKLCPSPEGVMEQEALYLAAIPNAATWSIDGDTLELRDADGAKLAGYRAAVAQATTESEAAPAPELAGTAWQWVAMTTPVEQINVADPSKYTVEFLADGVIGVTADCNTGSGTYEAADGQISINITATTLALCPPESLSDQFIRSLNAAAIYFMQDANLFIDQFASSGTMEFAPR
jgi:heat shock protein HslJ